MSWKTLLLAILLGLCTLSACDTWNGAEIWLISSADAAQTPTVPPEDASSAAPEPLYHITAHESGRTFTYTLTSRFVVTLDGRMYPQQQLRCEPGGIIGRITNVPSAQPPLYNAQFEVVAAGTCTLRDGSFSVTIRGIDRPAQ